MDIDLDGANIALHGTTSPIGEAALTALIANGGHSASEKQTPDILLVSCPLNPETDAENARATYDDARQMAVAMAARGSGRIVFLLSALAGMPMRRHPGFSMKHAAILAGMRTLAMEFGPKVLVNAVGVGAIGDKAALSGDVAMLGHVPVGRSGTVEEAVAVVLFFCDPLNSYTTGQMLSVDGGWTAGYGRNF